MFEILLNNLSLIIGILVVAGGSIFGAWKFHTSRVKNAFDEGKQEEICLTTIEGKADKAIELCKGLKKDRDEDRKNGDEHHRRLYDKLDDQNKVLATVQSDLSFVRGKLENE